MPEDSTPSPEVPRSPDVADVVAASQDDRLFERPRELLGPSGFAALQEARVLVVGLGGVGSHTVSALLRAGVGHLRLVDFDVVTRSSLGRMAMVCPVDIGHAKVDVLAARARELVPDVDVEPLTVFFHEDSADTVFGARPPDLLIDAIDSVVPKVALLREGHRRQVWTLSSMGAAGRRDPGSLRVGDLSETTRCPLARIIRRRLRRLGIDGGITCVYSVDTPIAPLPPDPDEPHYARGRVRNCFPNLPMMPGIFGYALASLAVTGLASLEREHQT